MALWVSERASQYLILVMAKNDVPRLILVLRKKIRLVFRFGKMNDNITLIYSKKITDFRDPWCMKGLKNVYA